MDRKLGKYSLDIINGMIDWVRVIDSDHRIVFMNKAMKDQIGDCTGMKCHQALGLNSPCPDCITDETLKTGRIHMKEETVNGRVYSVASSPIRDEQGRVHSAVEVFRDITKEKAMERSIREQNRKFNDDLGFAKMLQLRMLPQKGEVNGSFLVDYLYVPCEMLGGDLFDVFPVEERNTAVYIFDIAGHGVKSSMMTMFVRQTVRALAEEGCSPPLVLEGLLKKFLSLGLDDETFITVLYGIYDPEKSVFTYSNAGHNPPIVFRRGGAAAVEGVGLPICSLARGCDYHEYKLHLEKGDSLYLYTDGITEARNEAGAFFGVDGIIKALERGEGIEGVIKSVRQFSGGRLLDDIAILGAEVL